MDETLTFFAQLLKMTQTMVDDIVPDLLIDLDQKIIERLMDGAQKVDSSLQMFIKLCSAIAQNISRSCSTIAPEQGRSCNMLTAEAEQNMFNVKQSQPSQCSVEGDIKSTVKNFLNLMVNHDEEIEEENGDQVKETIWKGLLTTATKFYLSHDLQQIPQVYYCGICDKQAKAKHIWEAHLGGKNHLKLLEDVFAVQSICEVCNLHVYGDCQLIRVITASREHNALDTAIKDNHQMFAAHSTVAGTFRKGAVTKNKNAESSDNSDVSARKPIVSAPSPTESNSLVVSQDPKPIVQNPLKVPKVIFQGTEIHTDFVSLTDKIADYIDKHESFRIAYCRPCEIICESETLWNIHKVTRQHKGKMSSKHYKNVLCRCVQCEFIVTAGAKIAVTYMRYHIEQGHHQSTEGIKNEEYMEVKNMFLGTKIQCMQPMSKASSFKGSQETVYSVHSCAADLQSSSADLKSSFTDLRVCVAPTSASKVDPDACGSAASSKHWLDAVSLHSCKADSESSSAESRSSPDLRSYFDSKRASRAVAEASAPDALPRHPKDVGSKNAIQGADLSTPAASSSRPTGTIKKTSTNPYKSGITRSPSNQVSDPDELPARIPPSSALAPLSPPPPDVITFPPLPAQIPLPAQNYAPPAQKDALSGDLEFTFLKMLSRKEESFQKDTTFKFFTALCLECKSADFCSKNAWVRHLSSHNPTDSVGEVQCLQCNTSFYGDVGDINNSFINHDYHVCIDAMFSW